MVKLPTPEQQLAFLELIQRLFEEGEFVATYKFALLVAITDLAVEFGSDSGDALELPYPLIADRFLELYWQQALPYTRDARTGFLSQNRGRQAEVVGLIQDIQRRHQTLPRARASIEWAPAVRRTVALLKRMPLWRLQTLRRQEVAFLYVMAPDVGIRLLPGVMFSLRRFQGLIQQFAIGAWVAHIRANPRNGDLIGEASDLERFLFGTSRSNLAKASEVLRQIQGGACFYCERPILEGGEVDHFIPWSRYPRDLAHNFVLAHSRCNGDKRDLLAAIPHLERWRMRNEIYDAKLEAGLGPFFLADRRAMTRVAQWSYHHAFQTKSQSWLSVKQVVPLTDEYQRILAANAVSTECRH